ncbi:hypothetical protein MTR_7g078993 [Medicago truncatula]|uniref:Uncharacterized protein n=1 Tax=Medicago truncatula TaxID=3880 RepID=A0A072U0Y3_MEDTR|nr:hypothetical protein MTR_7g078993 [Medicago truncatula]
MGQAWQCAGPGVCGPSSPKVCHMSMHFPSSKLPQGGSEDLRKSTWIGWKNICLEKYLFGKTFVWGLRQMREFNIALLGLTWDLRVCSSSRSQISGSESLILMVVIQFRVTRSSSHLIVKNICFKIGFIASCYKQLWFTNVRFTLCNNHGYMNSWFIDDCFKM